MMIEKGYEASRATFYAHFADKDTLLASRIEALRAMPTVQQQHALVKPGELRERGFAFGVAMFEHACSRGGWSGRHQ